MHKLYNQFSIQNGQLHRKNKPCVGGARPDGYMSVIVNYKNKLVHRLTYEVAYGPIPDGFVIDHINGIRDDNRLDNLRLATPQQNRLNSKTPSHNTSKEKSKWEVKLNCKTLGRFTEKWEAICCRKSAELGRCLSKPAKKPSQRILPEHHGLTYDSGKLFRPSGKEIKVKPNPSGYLSLKIGQKAFLFHRVVWEMHNGTIPKGLVVDHINGDRLDNRLENLRLLTREMNSALPGLSRSTSGIKGLHFCNTTQKWYLRKDGRFHSLHATKGQAIEVFNTFN